MELGNQMKKYRGELSLSQDALAEKIYVSRQTISNWETGKSYPDVNSLIRMSEVFGISVDSLLKGDVEEMKKIIKEDDINEFTKLSWIFTLMFFAVLITPVPLAKFLGFWGLGIWGLIAAAAVVMAIHIEKKKKHFNIQTYREINAFLEGKSLDEIEAAREEGKRPYQKLLLGIICGIIALVICILSMYILK
ncbi:MAG: helix-turn-helix transcriptional regulator [Eubacterium sp.]|nr:helix-turn-helix transcriptional regulator [Eubacterium sp.]